MEYNINMLECISDPNNRFEPCLGFCSCGTVFEVENGPCPGCGTVYNIEDIKSFYGNGSIILLPDSMWREIKESEEANVQEEKES